jgi:RHS repeat-associated protein
MGNGKNLAAYQICPTKTDCFYTWTVHNSPLSLADDQKVAFGSAILQIHVGSHIVDMGEYSVVTPDGSVHPTVTAGRVTLPLNQNPTAGPEWSIDATGFFSNASDNVNPTFQMDRDGIRYFYGTTTPPPIFREDSNGNQIVEPAPNYNTYTDTVGRTVAQPPSPGTDITTNYSGCSGPLTITSAQEWSVPGPNGGTDNFKLCYVTITSTIPTLVINGITINGTTLTNTTMLQSIVLPNNTTWTFEYNDRNSGDPSTVNYFGLTQITLPTGGTISYTYVTEERQTAGADSFSRYITSRTVNANDGTGPQTWSYGLRAGAVTDPEGNDVVHTYTDFSSCECGTFYETGTKYYQGSSTSGTLLKTTQTDFNYSTTTPNEAYPGSSNVYPIRVTTTWPNGQVTKTETDLDALELSGNFSYGNVIAKREYDYGTGSPGALLRTTTTQYEAFINSAYLTNNLLALPSSIQITDGGGTQRAYTTYGYDEYALQTSGLGASQQLDTAPADGAQRGNQTTVHRWLNGSATATTNCNISVTNGYLVRYATYNNTGTIYQSTDSCGSSAGDSKHTTNYSYSSTYLDAYPTKITNPLSQSTTMAYDLNTGLVTSIADPNSQTTSFTYDNMGRIATASYPDGGSATITHQETTFPFSATLSKKITSSLNYVTTNVFDGLGRVSQSQLTSDPSGADYTDTTYDADGREYTVSNPYRTKTDPTYGITSSVYDALGRICVLIPPDGTAVANTSCPTARPSNDVFTTYSGSGTTVTDQQGISRKSQTDGLGRVTTVWEDPTDLNYETVYTYDALNDLATVVQGGSHNRTFAYDSLNRLTSSTNPESGTVTYTYDADSNVITKKDARSIAITYGYDVLNRMVSKTYSNGDPAVTYSYDQSGCLGLSACYNVGRRTGMTDAAGSESWAYDEMGRQLDEQRVINSITKSTANTYNLDGTLSMRTYPSGNNVVYQINAAEQTTGVTDLTNKYVVSASYSPAGDPSTVAASDGGLTSTLYYNTRLQPCRISVKSSGSVPTACTDTAHVGNVLDYTYNFSLGTSDNGNVMGITNNVDGTRSEQFTYGRLNRIVSAETASTFATSPANCWGESYTEDQWGNLTTIGVASTSYNGCTQESLSVTALASNQLSATGFSYDASGNVLTDGRNTYTWNAEGQIKSAAGVNYTYDGDGHRVEKSSGTLYWYGTSGDPLTETDVSGDLTYEYIFFAGKRIARRDSSGNAVYYFADHLGTSRVVTSSTGSILDQSDFYPFGGERVLTASSGNTYKFTGKERDSESGLDNFGARYDASNLGRFMTPDSPSYSNHKNPQSWNLYAYALNNPVTFRDADGHKIDCANNTSQCQADAAAATGNAQAAARVTTQTTTTQHSFLGIHWTTSETQIAIKGDVNSFRALSSNASKLADLVTSKDTVTVSYDQYAKPSVWANGTALNGGSTSFTPSQGYGAQAFIDPNRTPGAVYDSDAVAQGIPQANTGEEFGHEVLGHIWGEMFGGAPAGTRANMRDSIAGEDAVRALDPARGQKGLESHHNYNEMPPDPPKQ